MIRNIIFDFGDVFINLDKPVVTRELSALEDMALVGRLKALNDAFEIGSVAARDFLTGLQEAFPGRSQESLKALWNAMLLDFPEHRLHFLEMLAGSSDYRLFLLSNTNELHISHVMKLMGESRYLRFRNSFEGFYLSHEIGLRKPGAAVFEFVLQQHRLKAPETLFIDDTYENIVSARGLGMQAWHLQVGKEDITDLKGKL